MQGELWRRSADSLFCVVLSFVLCQFDSLGYLASDPPLPTAEQNAAETGVYSTVYNSTNNKPISPERIKFNDALRRLCPAFKSRFSRHHKRTKSDTRGFVNLRSYMTAGKIPLLVMRALQQKLAEVSLDSLHIRGAPRFVDMIHNCAHPLLFFFVVVA